MSSAAASATASATASAAVAAASTDRAGDGLAVVVAMKEPRELSPAGGAWAASDGGWFVVDQVQTHDPGPATFFEVARRRVSHRAPQLAGIVGFAEDRPTGTSGRSRQLVRARASAEEQHCRTGRRRSVEGVIDEVPREGGGPEGAWTRASRERARRPGTRRSCVPTPAGVRLALAVSVHPGWSPAARGRSPAWTLSGGIFRAGGGIVATSCEAERLYM